jgi:hypothetical protein
LSGLQRRCEDTAQHTDVSIRFWLRSSDPTHPYKAPFELVGRQKTARSYWRLFLRFLCFSFRLWRLPEVARASLCRRLLTKTQHLALQAAWSALGDRQTQDQRRVVRASEGAHRFGMAEFCSWSENDGYDAAQDSEVEPETEGTPIFPWLSSTRRTRRGAAEDYPSASEDDATDEDDSGSGSITRKYTLQLNCSCNAPHKPKQLKASKTPAIRLGPLQHGSIIADIANSGSV